RDLVERQDRKQGRERSPAAARRASARRRCRAVERERRRNEQQHPGPPRPEIVLSGKTKPEEQRRQRWSVLERKREKCRENEYRRRENDDREPGTADAGRDTCCVHGSPSCRSSFFATPIRENRARCRKRCKRY